MLIASLFLLAAAPLQDPGAAPPTNRADPAAERITCINRLRIGSRVNFETICHSKAEWDMIRSEYRRAIERGQALRG